MNKIVLSSMVSFLAVASVGTLYAAVQQNPSLTVFVSPDDKSTVMENVKTDQVSKLVTFYQQGNWLKVGDKTTGNVGWVNQAQYQKMVGAPSTSIQNTY